MRPCPAPHCGAYIESGSYCAKHAAERDAMRGRATARGYNAEWAIVSRDWLRRYPYCGQRIDGALHATDSRCVQTGERVRAEVTDHIVSIRDGGDRFNPNNFQSLCNRCNVLKG